MNSKLFSLCLVLALFTLSARAQQVPVIEKTLSNGMRLLLLPRHDEPTVAGGWVVHVGSANERPGITGIAHLFEHMMFKGTPTLGTKDFKKDVEIINEQERVRDLMRKEEANMRTLWRRGQIADLQNPDTWTARYKELQAQFKKLVDAQREILVKNEFDRIYTANGGSMMNAYTSHDVTVYFITVPANKLELWMWMESERLLRPVFREFYAERDVVFEERRMRTESTPTGRIEETFWAMFWESHPYSWPVVGWPSDIPAITKKQADEFYALYYAPQNLTTVLVGDFKVEEATALAEKYLGRIPRGKEEAPDVVTLEIKQPAEKRLDGDADTNPQVDIMWHTPAFGHPDTYALSVLAQILSTRTGRLYKGLVLSSKVATQAYAQQHTMRWASLFNVGGELTDGKLPVELEAGLLAEIEKVKTVDVPAEELQKVKNNFAAGEYRKLANNHAIMQALLRYDGLGRWQEINEAGPKLQAVTAADVRRVANTYLTKENRNVATIVRKAGKSASDDPDLAGLSPQQLPAVRQFLGRLKEQKSVEQLKTQLKQMEEQSGRADAKNQQFLNILKKKTAERIAELERK
ncbi:MAG: insulinase family protein [Verrucomicrobia bacterium]|nr:insulinase family protein [Verrucomicrobiota bacterium]